MEFAELGRVRVPASAAVGHEALALRADGDGPDLGLGPQPERGADLGVGARPSSNQGRSSQASPAAAFADVADVG